MDGGVNLYAYVDGNPLNHFDFLGLHPHAQDESEIDHWHRPEPPTIWDDLGDSIDINNPDKWWNYSIDLGQLIGCVSPCMAKKGAGIGAEALIAEMGAIGLSATGVGAMPVAIYGAVSNTTTTDAGLRALGECLKECGTCE